MSKMENDEARIRDAFYNTCDALNQQAKPESLKEQWWFEAGYKAALQQAKPKQGVGEALEAMTEAWMHAKAFAINVKGGERNRVKWNMKYVYDALIAATTQPIPVEPKQAQPVSNRIETTPEIEAAFNAWCDTDCTEHPCDLELGFIAGWKQSLAKLEANQALLRVAKSALEDLITLCENGADFRNGVSHNGIEEGEVIASKYMDAAREALKQIGEV